MSIEVRLDGPPGKLQPERAFERGETVEDLPGRDRLYEVQVEAGLAGAEAVDVLAPPRQRDQIDVAAPRLAADRPGRVVAVHARHADVEQHGMRTERRRLADGGRAVVRHAHLVAGHLEEHAEALRRVLLVVHHQDSKRGPPESTLRRRWRQVLFPQVL